MDEHEFILQSLKWIALVFAAGFVGFFGKFLGKILVSFFQKRGRASSGVYKSQKEHTEVEKKVFEKPSVRITSTDRHLKEQPGEIQESASVPSPPELKTVDEDEIIKKQEKQRQKYEKKHQKSKIKEQKKKA